MYKEMGIDKDRILIKARPPAASRGDGLRGGAGFHQITLFGISQAIGKWGMRIWAHKSTALACAHFMLAMRAHGFDTCPMEGLDSARVKQILGLPRQALVTMVISAGKRAEGGVYGERLRFDRKHFVHQH